MYGREITVEVDGVKIVGTVEKVKEMLGDRAAPFLSKSGYYYSASKGTFLYIRSMASRHIANALLKLYREWVASLSDEIKAGTLPPRSLISKLSTGPQSDEMKQLLAELHRRNTTLYNHDWTYVPK